MAFLKPCVLLFSHFVALHQILVVASALNLEHYSWRLDINLAASCNIEREMQFFNSNHKQVTHSWTCAHMNTLLFSPALQMNGYCVLEHVWQKDNVSTHGPFTWSFHTDGSLGRCSDQWLRHDAWNKLPGQKVLFRICMAYFCVMGSIPCKQTAWGCRKSHTAPVMFKCSSPSSVRLIAAWRARGFLQSLLFYSLFPRQMSSI